jgi:hypothetical protein
MRELEMPDQPWLNVEERIKRLREIGMSECICHLRHTYTRRVHKTSFFSTLRKKLVRGLPGSASISMITLFV